MRKLIFALLLMIPLTAFPQWNVEYNKNMYGQMIVRVINHNPYPVSCYFRDVYSYYTFVVPGRAISGWFLPAGHFQIDCR